MKLPRLFVETVSTAARVGLIAGVAAIAHAESVGEFSNHADIGAPEIAGSMTYDASIQEYRMSGAGANIWGMSDQFHFAWNPTKGDFIVRARVEFIGEGQNAHRKSCWMLRTSTALDSAYVDACIHGDGLGALQFRRKQGATTEELRLPIRGVDVIQLERRGNVLTFSGARHGEPFVTTEVSDVDIPNEALLGLFICSHNAPAADVAIFRNVRIIQPAKPGFRPYHDYIGSRLEILHVFSGKRELRYSSAEPFEAPNWMPDGRTLILNVSGSGASKGLLRTYDLVTGAISPLETGAAIHNNNDHVLSFDGEWLGVSNHTADAKNQSVIYILPSRGGAPKRVTANAPSYLHGWSPDGRWLVFTGGRNGNYDIYKIPVTGGEEVRLTTAEALDDGPEFSPDGNFIYFNSARTGRMQLWRMKPDGSAQEQLTNDEFNNWFPHISPDGKWIAFLSFGQDVKPDDHPYYRQVYIRLMPASGGTPRVIAYVYGGQGTMNVPSWSPDSSRLAFVSNSGLD